MNTSLNRCFLGLITILLCLPRAVFSAGVVSSATDAALRAAMAGGGTVTFNCEGTITLTGTIAIASSTVINGTGHSITLSGGNAVQLFSVSSGVNASFINLTLANGLAQGAAGTANTDGLPGLGGAIFNNGGTVALTGCIVASNNAVGGAGLTNTSSGAPLAAGAGMGGAIYNLAGNLSVTNCAFVANRSIGGAGGYWIVGVSNGGGGSGGDASGGAIYSLGGSVTVQSSSFVLHASQGGNPGYPAPVANPGQAGSGLGGVLWTSNAIANFYHSTFTGNLAVGADLPWTALSRRVGSGKGGAILAANGTVNCVDCTFGANTVIAGYKTRYGIPGLAQGGAICSSATLSVFQCSFYGNYAHNAGGAYVDFSAGESSGGGIFNGNTLSLSDSLFANNTVLGGDGGFYGSRGGIGKGGAICNPGTLTATNCTFTANAVTGGHGLTAGAPGGQAAGGGLFNDGSATLVNLTFATNNATGGAGSSLGAPGPAGAACGGALCNSNGTVNLYNTILAGSTSGSNCWGTMFDYGHNLSSDNSAGFYAAGSLNNTDPKLGPLGNYGGSTLTFPLLAGSPAIDGGSTATAPATDQRGHARPYGSAADIGAFESSPPYFIGGQVSGQTLRDEVTIVIGVSNLATTNLGHYGASIIPAGTYAVTPTSPDYLFIPANRSITVGPDQFGINFQAYHWNALSLEVVTNGVMRCVIADTNGLTCRVLTSTNLVEWLPVSTNVVGPSNYFEVSLPITGAPARYYRTAIP